jgi:hypothetical protein
MSQSEVYHPSIVPEDEIEVPDDTSFVALCRADIADHVEKQGWRFGDSILTRHPHWGLIWRVDIQTGHEAAQSASGPRYICWRPPDMTDGIGGTTYLYVDKENRLRSEA